MRSHRRPPGTKIEQSLNLSLATYSLPSRIPPFPLIICTALSFSGQRMGSAAKKNRPCMSCLWRMASTLMSRRSEDVVHAMLACPVCLSACLPLLPLLPRLTRLACFLAACFLFRPRLPACLVPGIQPSVQSHRRRPPP